MWNIQFPSDLASSDGLLSEEKIFQNANQQPVALLHVLVSLFEDAKSCYTEHILPNLTRHYHTFTWFWFCTHQDHSYEGQLRIDYKSTVYGNEVYLGCFTDNDVTYRTLAYTVPLSHDQVQKMTPDFCINLCRYVIISTPTL